MTFVKSFLALKTKFEEIVVRSFNESKDFFVALKTVSRGTNTPRRSCLHIFRARQSRALCRVFSSLSNSLTLSLPSELSTYRGRLLLLLSRIVASVCTTAALPFCLRMDLSVCVHPLSLFICLSVCLFIPLSLFSLFSLSASASLSSSFRSRLCVLRSGERHSDPHTFTYSDNHPQTYTRTSMHIQIHVCPRARMSRWMYLHGGT